MPEIPKFRITLNESIGLCSSPGDLFIPEKVTAEDGAEFSIRFKKDARWFLKIQWIYSMSRRIE
ncbi:MAG: hypothetical protein O3C43_04750 [Verrucomicrobia bacterium]|nr:hypothetical protein [Verrucomicrobiota bacterium]MDA1065792.1 hypothetical protein [Verrucomicrobiota bacterium]